MKKLRIEIDLDKIYSWADLRTVLGKMAVMGGMLRSAWPLDEQPIGRKWDVTAGDGAVVGSVEVIVDQLVHFRSTLRP